MANKAEKRAVTERPARTVLVTGASRGLGAATAAAFARQGDTVFANHPSDDAETHRQAIDEWRDQAGIPVQQVIPVVADVSCCDQVDEMFKTLQQHSGNLDVLVNNAGINRDRTVAKMSDQQWQSVLDVNLNGTFYCCRAAIPLLAAGGRIISISSLVAYTGNFGVANYAASKAGVLGLTKTLARELASRRINVNAICPGFIDTEMMRSIPEDVLEKLIASIPLGRRGTPEDIAGCVLFLASRDADFITGQAIHVNGGVFMG